MLLVLTAGIWIGYNYRGEFYELFHKKDIKEKKRKQDIANEKRRATNLKKKGLYDKTKAINKE